MEVSTLNAPEGLTMDETYVVTVFVVLAEMCNTFLPKPKYRPKMVPAEILLVAVVAARYFNNNLERALLLMAQTGYIPPARRLSISRFNRQLHRYADFLDFCLQTLMELSCAGEAFIIDSMPLPVCKRARARRCRKVRGRDFCGYCAAKKEKFFGWRLHLICLPDGRPIAFELMPGAYHDLDPIYELTVDLPSGSALYGDKGYNYAEGEAVLAQAGLRLIPIRKKNKVYPKAMLGEQQRMAHLVEASHIFSFLIFAIFAPLRDHPLHFQFLSKPVWLPPTG
jgi:hypothetical protein